MARLKNVEGVTLEPLWDQIIMPSAIVAGPEVYNFFTVTKGSKDPQQTGTAVKSFVQTNLTGGGQRLPKPEAFSILGIALVPEFGANVTDLATIYNKSWFEIRGTGNSTPFRCPTRCITAGTGQNRTDSGNGLAGSPIPGAILSFPDEHAIEVPEGEQIYASINFDASQTLSGASTAVNLMLVFWGLHKKGVATA